VNNNNNNIFVIRMKYTTLVIGSKIH